ncbi:protein kinase domain-containing protein [Timonella sp. A28]|uniref:serine/threonine-protein kinase n=1 Tax=Timonella sp. A28 TaxID=3442640 RepID=UPI003EBB4971
MKPQPGLALGSRYRLVRQIAVGGMGEVWVAKDESLARDIAIKVLKEEFVGNSDFLNRFRVEARNAASLSHAHIAQLYDYGEQDNSAYLVMELVSGEPMSDLLEREPVLNTGKLLHLLAQTSRALHAAHVGGVVHRDIKPGNIIIEHTGDVKITDFGVSLAANQIPMTAAGMVMGTAQYLSPEQAVGKPATGVSDIYALGVVAYEAIAGNRPFTGKTPVDIAVAHVNQPVPPLPKNTHPELDAVVMRMLAKDPLERPRSGAALAHTFETLAQKIAENPWPHAVRSPHGRRAESASPSGFLSEDTGPRLTRRSSPGESSPRPAAQHGAPAPQQRAASPEWAPNPPEPSRHEVGGARRAEAPVQGRAQQPAAQPVDMHGTRVFPPIVDDRTPPGAPSHEGGQRASSAHSQWSPSSTSPGQQPSQHNVRTGTPHASSSYVSSGHSQGQQRQNSPIRDEKSSFSSHSQRTSHNLSLIDRVKSLGWFTLLLIGVIAFVLFATSIKAIVSEGHSTGFPTPVSMKNSTVQFISVPSVALEVGERRNTSGFSQPVAQLVKDAKW